MIQPKPRVKDYPYVAELIDFGDGHAEHCVHFVDFPNIVGQGDTFAEALKEARENLRAFFWSERKDHHPIPKPTVTRV